MKFLSGNLFQMAMPFISLEAVTPFYVIHIYVCIFMWYIVYIIMCTYF